ncbi:MAG: hypothetical protein J0H94_02495 [Rhizobiales bacterium]|jgi:hypothetical protein|nr:hypothetical protein [Hyphomicrobiales bacterium]
MFYITPLMVIPLVIFNIVAFIWGHDVWSTELLGLTMLSGQRWAFSLEDLMVLVGVVCLFFEILKSTGSTTRIITNHIFSTIIFIVYLIEFLVVGYAAHSVFFLLMILALFDVVAGFTITIKTASRDVTYSRGEGTPPAI